MQDALVQVKVDNELKTKASNIYNTLGLDLPTAIRIFLRASIASKGLPFALNLLENEIPQKKSVKEFFGTMDDQTYNEMMSALDDCSKVDENEW